MYFKLQNHHWFYSICSISGWLVHQWLICEPEQCEVENHVNVVINSPAQFILSILHFVLSSSACYPSMTASGKMHLSNALSKPLEANLGTWLSDKAESKQTISSACQNIKIVVVLQFWILSKKSTKDWVYFLGSSQKAFVDCGPWVFSPIDMGSHIIVFQPM